VLRERPHLVVSAGGGNKRYDDPTLGPTLRYERSGRLPPRQFGRPAEVGKFASETTVEQQLNGSTISATKVSHVAIVRADIPSPCASTSRRASESVPLFPLEVTVQAGLAQVWQDQHNLLTDHLAQAIESCRASFLHSSTTSALGIRRRWTLPLHHPEPVFPADFRNLFAPADTMGDDSTAGTGLLQFHDVDSAVV
jgi:hypothetical protein